MRRRGGVGEEIARLQPAVVVIAEKEGAAMKGRCALFECEWRGRAARASKLGVEVRGRNAYGLDGVSRRDQHLKQSGLLVVVHTFDLEVIGQAGLAVDLRFQTVL